MAPKYQNYAGLQPNPSLMGALKVHQYDEFSPLYNVHYQSSHLIHFEKSFHVPNLTLLKWAVLHITLKTVARLNMITMSMNMMKITNVETNQVLCS